MEKLITIVIYGDICFQMEKKKLPLPRMEIDVYLTIDQKIQTFLEDAMNNVVKEYKPKKIIAIVADPKTGEILAMGQRPSFHPETKDGISDSWHNEAIENSFEPGSTMKIFTLSAAVQEKVFNPNETYQSGSYKVTENTPPIHDWKTSGWGHDYLILKGCSVHRTLDLPNWQMRNWGLRDSVSI